MDAEKGNNDKEEPVEFGGLVWNATDGARRLEYTSIQPGCGDSLVSQYPAESSSAGSWYWRAQMGGLIDPVYRPSLIKMEASGIEETRHDAMQACLDAKDKFIEDIKLISMALGVGNYATGFMDGQAKLSRKISEVLP